MNYRKHGKKYSSKEFSTCWQQKIKAIWGHFSKIQLNGSAFLVTGICFFGFTYNAEQLKAKERDDFDIFEKSVLTLNRYGITDSSFKQQNFQISVADNSNGFESYKLAMEAERKGNKREAVQHLISAISAFKQTKDIPNYIVTNLALSQIYIEIGRLSKALVVLEEIIPLVERENIPDLYAIGLGLLGNYYLRVDRYDDAILQYQKSLNIKSHSNTLIKLSQAYFQRANNNKKRLHLALDPSELSLLKNQLDRDLKQGVKIAKSAILISQTPKEQISSRLNILRNFKPSLKEEEFESYKLESVYLLNSLADSSFKVSSLISLASLFDRTLAKDYLLQSKNIAEAIKDRYNSSLASEKLGRLYFSLNENELAKKYTEDALSIAQFSHITSRMFYQSWQLAEIELALGNKNEASNAYWVALSDLKSPLGEFGFHNLLFELQEDAQLFLRDYLSLLFELNQFERAIEVLSILKLSEFQGYFNDPCFDLYVYSQVEKSLEIPGLDNKKTARIYTFIEKNKINLILRLPNNNFQKFDINISKLKFKNKLDVFYNTFSRQGFDYIIHLKQLYSLIIAPIESELKKANIENLVFLQDGILRNIPMEVLLKSDDKYLIEKYQILYVTGLQGTLPSNRQKRDSIFFGVSEARLGLGSLPFINKEASYIRDLLKAMILLNKDFTFTNFVDSIKNQNYSVIHMATHGSFQGSAKNSWLLAYDRKMSLEEIKLALLSSNLPPQLLVFSACETAISNSLATLGFSGVALRARVNNVIGSLWQVPDDSTSFFMKELYQELNAGSSLIEAKRNAQIKTLKEYQKPLNWGGLILVSNF